MTTAEPARNLEQLPVVLALSERYKNNIFNGKESSTESRWRIADSPFALWPSATRSFFEAPIYKALRERLARRIQSRTWPDGQPRWKNGLATPPTVATKAVFPYREGSQFVQWALCGQRMDWSQCSLLIRHFRPRRFFTHRNITSNEKPPVIRASGLARQMTESATVDQTQGISRSLS